MRAFYLPHLDCYLRYYDVAGNEPVRVYLHGLGRSSAALVSIAGHHALAGRRSLLVDFLGYGFSDKPDGFGYSLREHTDTIVELLDALGVTGCEVVGHSLGGIVAILLAAQRPDQVSKIVMLEANLDPGGGPMSQAIIAQSEQEYVSHGHAMRLKELQEVARSEKGPVWPAVIGMHEVASPVAVYRTARSCVDLTKPTTRELLLKLEIPRTFIVGEDTLGTSPTSGEDAAGLEGTGVDVFVLPGAGHPMMYQNPDALAELIARALTAGASSR